MSIKRIVDTSFWTDDSVVDEFSPEDKLFFLYLMTNPHTTQLGIYPINLKVAAFELGYSIEAIKVLFDRFENKYGIIKRNDKTTEVAIKNYLRYSIVKGGKPVEDCLLAEIAKVKDKELLQYVYENLKDREDLNASVVKILPLLKQHESYHESSDESYHNDNDNDNDNENEDILSDKSDPTPDKKDKKKGEIAEITKEVIAYLNEKAGRSFKATTRETKSVISARIREGFVLEDFKKVIDTKVAQWNNDKVMHEYVRPQTLFGTKMESYLQAQPYKDPHKVDRKYGDNGFKEEVIDW